MLIAISGSQGVGKTTIINELIKQSSNRFRIERKTSRSILQDWDVSLADVNADPMLTLKFQDEILQRKIYDDQPTQHGVDDIWFTERTPIDLLGYATVQLGSINTHSTWLDQYAEQCINFVNSSNTYSHIFFLTAGHFLVSHDGVRGSNQYYSTLVDAAMFKFHTKYVNPQLLTVIDSSNAEDRLNQINNKILKLTMDNE